MLEEVEQQVGIWICDVAQIPFRNHLVTYSKRTIPGVFQNHAICCAGLDAFRSLGLVERAPDTLDRSAVFLVFPSEVIMKLFEDTLHLWLIHTGSGKGDEKHWRRVRRDGKSTVVRVSVGPGTWAPPRPTRRPASFFKVPVSSLSWFCPRDLDFNAQFVDVDPLPSSGVNTQDYCKRLIRISNSGKIRQQYL